MAFNINTARVVRDRLCSKRPFVVVDAAGYEWAKPKRGGGMMARHFSTEQAAREAIERARKNI